MPDLPSVVWAIAALSAGVVLSTAAMLVWGMAQSTRRTAFRVGDRWGGEPVEVTQWAGDTGYVLAGGERWRAISQDALAVGDRVRVAKMNGLTLEVRKD